MWQARNLLNERFKPLGNCEDDHSLISGAKILLKNIINKDLCKRLVNCISGYIKKQDILPVIIQGVC